LVILLLFIAKLKTPQDIRQKASGSKCFLAIRGLTDNRVKIIEGVGGQQVLNGQTVCVAGLGDRYASFYQSKITAETDLNTAHYPCKDAQSKLTDHPVVGDSCNVDGGQGKIICVGGPMQESFICVNNIGKEHHYRLLANYAVLADNSSTEIETNSASQAAVLKFKDWRDLPITIKVGFVVSPASEESHTRQDDYWPKLAFFLNNGRVYRGSYDYGTCAQQRRQTGTLHCGFPNQYKSKLVDDFSLTGEADQLTFKEWSVRAGDLLQPIGQRQLKQYVTKISFVFYNDYWPGGKHNRSVAIHSIEFLAPNRQVLLRYTPKQLSAWPNNTKNKPQLKRSFYFDMGSVNARGKETVTENGFVNAFDKKKLQTVNDNQSQRFNRWLLDRDGSFNLVTEELFKPIFTYFKNHK